ncbi:MAG: hypothetical protein RL138_944 [Bacteroidota bacterium]|jgi:hypothetical protein
MLLCVAKQSRMKKIILSFVAIATGVALMATQIQASSNGRSNLTGGAGQSTCSNCHGGAAAGGSVALTSDIPAGGYTPGTTYHMTATVTYSGRSCFGIDLIALNSSNASTGTITVTDATYTKTVTSASKVNLEQKTPKPNGTFTFDWTAPAAGTGNVTFYFAGLAANNNGTDDTGDYTYTGNQVYAENVGGTSGIEAMQASASVFPNPATTQLAVKSNIQASAVISVLDINGRLMNQTSVENAANFDLNIAELNAGVYFVHVQGAGKTANVRFVKN